MRRINFPSPNSELGNISKEAKMHPNKASALLPSQFVRTLPGFGLKEFRIGISGLGLPGRLAQLYNHSGKTTGVGWGDPQVEVLCHLLKNQNYTD
jgi:hypothetical protein